MDDGIFWEFERWIGRFAFGAAIMTHNYLLGFSLLIHDDPDHQFSLYFGIGPYTLFLKGYPKWEA